MTHPIASEFRAATAHMVTDYPPGIGRYFAHTIAAANHRLDHAHLRTVAMYYRAIVIAYDASRLPTSPRMAIREIAE